MGSEYQISHWEKIFGGDLWRLRNVMRRLVSVLFSLIPVRKWRHKARDRFDRWIIALNRSKIFYFIKNYPDVRSEIETVKSIVKNRSSIGRFGDGELNMCIGRNKSFQKYDKRLVDRLKEILMVEEDNFLVGINTVRSEADLTPIWQKFVVRRGNRVLQLLDRGRTYESSTITTFFPSQQNEFDVYVENLRAIWNDRKVLFVVGKNSRFFFLEELFDNIVRYEFVYGPAENAFSVYDELIDRVQEYGTDWLVMISLGPTATVMAYDLFRLGYQAIDLGQTPSKYHKAKYGTLYPVNQQNN
ncbi:GT-D fold domain-containing glycosyltransferase [uncultured Desulfuromusa sp.]|uniref:GT-D fold domain-containing glycosyltransferase n=1 Tax=uncultured Desulfuromusa sp. TaxID=219183 RepID=UPI002AA80F12|nr:GT-D fold domain-containing glycosyltransferase [uncultured Desulfuromusa sp.]